MAEYGRGRQIAVHCRTLPYIVVHYRILSYIALIRNRSLLAKSVETGGRAGGVTGVSRDNLLLYSIFFAVVYISSSLILRAVLNIISISILSTPCLPLILTLGISLLLVSKVTFNLDSVVVEPGFILKAIYNYSLTG